MKFFGTQVLWQDFVPPVAEKFWQRIPFGNHRRHPFTAIPASLDATVILDVGANIGRVAEAGLRTFPRSTVYCFEPVSTTFRALSRRLAPFGNRVRLYPYALSDQNAESVINLTSFHGANSIHPQALLHRRLNPHVRELATEQIQLRRLDDLAEELPARCDVMKIDVEGHELQVLRGGEVFIRDRVDTILIEVSLMRDDSWENQSLFEIFALLKQLGFCLINIVDMHRARQPDLMLIQMDCVFRKHSRMNMSADPVRLER